MGVWVVPGPEQAAYGLASKRHWKVEPAWLEANPKVGVWSAVTPPFATPEVIVVCGGTVSTVNERVFTVDSLPAASIALT